jgi:hypothetical protein
MASSAPRVTQAGMCMYKNGKEAAEVIVLWNNEAEEI